MSVIKWRFVKRKDPEQVVVVQDVRSAEILAGILTRAEPGEWSLQEESVLGSMLGSVAPQAQPAQPAPQPVQQALPVQPAPQPVQQALPVQPAPQPVQQVLPVQPAPQPVRQVPPPLPTAVPLQVEEPSLTLTLEEETAAPVHQPAPPKVPPPLPPRPGTPLPGAVIASPVMAVPAPKLPENPQEKYPDKRRFKRFNMEFKVILVCEGKTFRTYSSDVSIGGMSLKHKVPPFMLNNYCRVVVSRRDSLENIEFNCRIHGGFEDPRRVEFLDCDPRTVRSFEQWIERGASQEFSRQKTA